MAQLAECLPGVHGAPVPVPESHKPGAVACLVIPTLRRQRWEDQKLKVNLRAAMAAYTILGLSAVDMRQKEPYGALLPLNTGYQ